ncbi:MAG: hypothetical protein ACREA2_08245 [Blastocatellia bacterium]
MSMKSFGVRRDARPLVVRVSLAALLAFAAVWWGSAGFASKGLVPEAIQQSSSKTGGLDDKPAALEGYESRRVEHKKSAGPCPVGADTDTLDMVGDWTLTYGYSVGLTTDASGHHAPAGSLRPFRVHFDLIGPGDHGGVKFKGHFIGAPGRVFYGETFYDCRGVQIVRMHLEDSAHPGRYYELLSGKHELYTREPTRVEILGGWVDVGDPGGRGHIGNFVMVKDRSK